MTRRDWITLSRVEWVMVLVTLFLALFGLAVMNAQPVGQRGPEPVRWYEDGSIMWSDGTTSCDPDGLCAR